jgi:hypothetical protein
VCSLAVAYIGRKVYGNWWHVAEAGSNMIWAKPFASLAVIEPLSLVVRS